MSVTVAMARRGLAKRLRDAGLDTPDLDARLLVGHALGLDHTAMASGAAHVLGAADEEAVARAGARRLAREPVARILGSQEFWGLALALNEATLVPRPETETVVEAALAFAPHATLIADIGTGSGALLLALLSEWPWAGGIGTDISARALACASANACTLAMAQRTRFVACDYGAALAGPFDLVVANPPYIPSAEIAGLAPEVRDFDPSEALDGGADGLQAYRAIASDAGRYLAPAGRLVVEIGMGQSEAVSGIFEACRFATLDVRSDLAGIPRAMILAPAP